jgi:phosphate transport system substrate-binding protein
VRAPPILSIAATAVLALGAAACGGSESGADNGTDLTGKIAIDGSSTVGPFAQAAAEQFQQENPGVQITVGESGTGGGFEKFCNGETDISNASRPVKPDEEALVCQKKGIAYRELHVANDGIAVVTNKALKIDCLTTAQLKELWNSKSTVERYADIDPELPGADVSLYGPGTDSGTFDFFTDEINGEEGDSRKDYQPSEDDNVLVEGVAGDENGLGYFGFSYYEQNADKLNLVGIDSGDGCLKPAKESIQDGSYNPLARPLYMYPSDRALQRPEVAAFAQYVVENHDQIAAAAQFVALTDAQAGKAKAKLERALAR